MTSKKCRAALAFLSAGWVLTAATWAQVTERVAVAPNGVEGNGDSSGLCISGDGRYAAFHSRATNLVPGDANGWAMDVYVRDRITSVTKRVNVSTNGVQANADSFVASISTSGRFVTFTSYASNLVPGDTNVRADAFVHDRQTGVTQRLSVSTNGVQGNQDSLAASISADGRYAVFASDATNLVPGDTNIWTDIFVRDRHDGSTIRVNVDTKGFEAQFVSYDPEISADGRFVTYRSAAWNLVSGDTNAADDVFVRDLVLRTTERVSLATGALQGNWGSTLPSISTDGRYVAFESGATNLVAGDTNGQVDVYVRDRLTATTQRVSIATGGAEGHGYSGWPAISADGLRVAYFSEASDLVSGDTNSQWDVYVHDRSSGVTERVSVSTAGTEANGASCCPTISGDGRYVAFESSASDLVTGDTGSWYEVFLHDSSAGGFASTCEPGVAGTTSCPCSNPPSGPRRGCDNSAGSGGAALSASGVAYLSMDSLVLGTTGEPPTALSMLIQGNASIAAGVPFGQGVRCVGGQLLRLYTKHASSGRFGAPDFAAGDATISATSAARGDTIRPGESRWYCVVYRDTNVLGGCPATSTFNASQAGKITWWP